MTHFPRKFLRSLEPIPVILVLAVAKKAVAFPNACTVVSTPAFESCLDLNVTADVCGVPPYTYPCARITYYQPSTFVEVVSGGKDTFFSELPFTAVQMSANTSVLPYASESVLNGYSYQAHALTPPLLNIALGGLPCDQPLDRMCFGAMSEHVQTHWNSGAGDASQPKFLAWSLKPEACLLAGSLSSLTGTFGSVGVDASLCSFDHSFLTTYPPSMAPVCTGWGVHFPRMGTVVSSDQITASLVIASRIKTLGSEVFTSVPSSLFEKWSMLYPSRSSCFREGQNMGLLLTKNVNDLGRITNAMPKDYLYVSWQHVSCKRNWARVGAMYAGLAAAKAACEGLK